MKKRIHVVSDCKATNGMFVAAGLMARNEGSRVMDCGTFLGLPSVLDVDEVVVHGCWLPCYWRACWKVLKGNCRLVRMTHANLDPVRYRFHGWKKKLVSPIERWLFSKCDRVMVTCGAEKEWCERWGLKGPFEIVDLKQFFDFKNADGLSAIRKVSRNLCAYAPANTRDGATTFREVTSLHVLYLGRPHPLKGTAFLERAVKGLKGVELRMVSDHTGEELERDWAWCDVLCLPTLSDNFGLVVAEALERGKRVITTDGAPAWEPTPGAEVESLTYLRGFREGSDEARVEMLKVALSSLRVTK